MGTKGTRVGLIVSSIKLQTTGTLGRGFKAPCIVKAPCGRCTREVDRTLRGGVPVPTLRSQGR